MFSHAFLLLVFPQKRKRKASRGKTSPFSPYHILPLIYYTNYAQTMGAIVRTTRSQRIFSTWAPDIPSDPSFDFLPALYAAMFLQDECPSEFGAMDADLDPALNASSAAESQDVAPTPISRKAKLKAAGHECRKRRKKEGHLVDPKLLERFPDDSFPRVVDMSFEEAKVTSTAFIAINDVERTQKTYSLEELIGRDSAFKFELQTWNGRDPRLIVDRNGIVCAILAGHPDAEDWPIVHRDAAQALEQARGRCAVEHTVHRRGAFVALNSGISHGGGQRFPMNLVNKEANREILSELNGMRCFIRIANFASAVMARRAPALHHHYETTLKSLEEKHPHLRRPFPDSVLASVAYNLGPQTVCFTHKDPANFAGGLCTVTPVGDFDPTKGGHLVLWECRLVVEFPPGSTILLPSAVIAHSNTSISPSETRYSFTQYSASGLFRWVNNDFKRSVDFRKSLSTMELEQEEEKNRNRWKEVLMMLPRTKVVDKSRANDTPHVEI